MREAMGRLSARNPNPGCELEWTNPFTLLVSVVLSAQATDRSVNENTRELFALADTPGKMLALGRERIEGFIRPIGLSATKSRNVAALSERLESEFGGEVPRDRDSLMSLPGVGRKTANVVLNVAFGEPTMPVDTHILRISPRIGLAEGRTPEAVEESLLSRIPGEFLRDAHHLLLLHGRYVCRARSQDCGACVLSDLCRHNEVPERTKARGRSDSTPRRHSV